MSLLKTTPWDAKTFGLPTYELQEYSANALKECLRMPGHYTLKVDPLEDKALLQQFNFYYCDTLLEPCCSKKRLRIVDHPDLSVSKTGDLNKIMLICDGAFKYGRFHRDMNMPIMLANTRYCNWLKEMAQENSVYGLYIKEELAGFIAYQSNCLVLHAVSEKYQGKGLSKFWWSMVCADLLSQGNETIKSSISASNLAALNLYASLGFSFRNTFDVYHRVVTDMDLQL
jgi:L-amino acid N-acyltransferase YncA